MDEISLGGILMNRFVRYWCQLMIKNNGDEIGNEQLINIIHKQIGIIYTQLSLFDFEVNV